MSTFRTLGRRWVLVILGLLMVLLVIALLTRGAPTGSISRPTFTAPPTPTPTATSTVIGTGTGIATDASSRSIGGGQGNRDTVPRRDPFPRQDTFPRRDTGSTGLGRVRNEIDTVRASDLPPTARRAIALIDAGGPYPYRKDGTIFNNSEGLLPRATRGTYREFTVPTPHTEGRGARRIVKARDGTLYYTSDHYRSFRRILR